MMSTRRWAIFSGSMFVLGVVFGGLIMGAWVSSRLKTLSRPYVESFDEMHITFIKRRMTLTAQEETEMRASMKKYHAPTRAMLQQNSARFQPIREAKRADMESALPKSKHERLRTIHRDLDARMRDRLEPSTARDSGSNP